MNDNLFRPLDSAEEEEFRQWTRDNYKPGSPINSTWHPIVQDECKLINSIAVLNTIEPDMAP